MLSAPYLSRLNPIILIIATSLPASIHNSSGKDGFPILQSLISMEYQSTTAVIERKNYLDKRIRSISNQASRELEKITAERLLLFYRAMSKSTIPLLLTSSENWRDLERKFHYGHLLKSTLKNDLEKFIEFDDLRNSNKLEVERLESVLEQSLQHSPIPRTSSPSVTRKMPYGFIRDWIDSTVTERFTRQPYKKFQIRSPHITFPGEDMILPTSGPISKRSGEPFQKGGVSWEGIIVENKPGEPVKAVGDGEVVFAADFSHLKNLVILDHANGYLTLYGNIQKLLVSTGMSVRYGQQIGVAPSNLSKQLNGIYFEVRENGVPVDPKLWFNY